MQYFRVLSRMCSDMDGRRCESYAVFIMICFAQSTHLHKPGLAQIPVGFALSLSITNCTRLLLNIRRAYYIGPRGVSIYVHDGEDNPDDSSTSPIVEWGARCGPEKSEDGGRVEIAESLLAAAARTSDLPDRESVEVKLEDGHGQADPARWQYELRTMKAKRT